MDIRTTVKSWLQESISVKQAIHDNPHLRKQIEIAASLLIGAAREGSKILVCGNGGSASDSAHFVGELLNRFTLKREYPLPAIDLSAPNATITAISNDYSFDDIFSKQIEALMQDGDILVAISTSGKSKNILNALIAATNMNNTSILLTGEDVDVSRKFRVSKVQHVNVPSKNTPIIQEAHISIIHLFCALIDEGVIKT